MAKIPNDKYYTSTKIAEHCVNKVKEIVADDVTEVIEPSAGNGAFIKSIENNFNCEKYYFDIIPEHNKIKQQDFLELDLEYKQGRVIVGNPPFGNRSTLVVKFFKKAVRLGDYIAFILPISQLNNVKQLYEFDLIHSEDLGNQDYSGVDLHCCFNIYKRPKSGILNSKPKIIEIDGLEVIEYRRGYHKPNRVVDSYFYSVCSWGGSLGKNNNCIGDFAKEMYFYSNDKDLQYLVKNIDWKNELKTISTPYMPKGKVLEIIQSKLKNQNPL